MFARLVRSTLLIGLFPVFARADALTDLRAALTQLAATAPVHGSLDVLSTSTNNEEDRPDNGKVTVSFDISDAGLRILYPRAALTQADQEAHGQAIDPERATPTRSGLRRVRPLEVQELLDAAVQLLVTLEGAELVDAKTVPFHGKNARLLVLKLKPKLSKSANKHLKSLESSMSIWLGDDGVPIAAEQTINAKASFLLISFESDEKESWTFARSGDRLIVTRHDSTQKADGLGQHSTTQTTAVVRIE